MGKYSVLVAYSLTLLFIPFFHVDSARAANAVTITKHDPFLVQVHLKRAPNEAYSLKTRFSNNTTTCEPSCSGEQWSGAHWLKQTDSWDDFPKYSADSNGLLSANVIVQATTSANFLQLAVRPQGSSSTDVQTEETITVRIIDSSKRLHLQAFNKEGTAYTSGYFSLEDGGNERLIPLLNDSVAITGVEHEQIRVGFYSTTGQEIEVPKLYKLIEKEGHYYLTLNKPRIEPYTPRITSQPDIRVGEKVVFNLTASRPYTGKVTWFINGEKQTESFTPILTHNFTRAGRYTMEAQLEETDEKATFIVQLISPGNITLKKILPNPKGRDSGHEEIILHNGNPFPVSFNKWELRARLNQTIIPINGTVLAMSDLLVTPEKQLRNSGAIYDLYNESNQLIDTLTYPKVAEGQYVIHDGIFWTVSPTEKNAKMLQSQETKRNVEGKVLKPKGKSLDIQAASGEIIHIVIHKSFTGFKPTLHVGDFIRVSGVWKKSSKRNYLSVRLGDSLTLISSVKKKHTTKTKNVSHISKESGLIKNSLGTTVARAAPPSFQEPKVTSKLLMNRRLWRNMLSGVIALGFVLVLPFSRKEPL